jgi:Tfp pilus assembly protein PilV
MPSSRNKLATAAASRVRRLVHLRRRFAFTLIEGLIACTILAFSVVGVLSMVNATYAQSRATVDDSFALSLARQLAEEMAAKPFARGPDAGWDAGVGNRNGYDDVFDYHGYTDSTSSLTTSSGQTVSAGFPAAYTRTVTVQAGVSLPAVLRSSELALVTTTVTPTKGRPVVVQKLITAADPRRQDS